ncbi:MAG: QueT transporter family protein [Clostridia bacterium]
MKNNSVRFLTESAIIAAAYVVLTFVSASMNLAYLPLQFRASEALTILPILTPAAIPGLAVGCFISNLASPMGIIDWIFGTGATLIAALISYKCRNITVKKIPVISFLSPVVINALVIGMVISAVSDLGSFSFTNINIEAFSLWALSVGLGELAVIVILGTPLYFTMKKLQIHQLKK